MTKSELKLTGALLGTGVVQPHQSYSKAGRVEVLCRQVPGQGTAVMEMLTELLRKASAEGITMHACKRFVLKDDRLVFGWNFAIETKNAKELEKAIDKLSTVLEKVKPDLSQVDERPTAPAPQREEDEEEEAPAPPPPPKKKSGYKTDAQVAKELGIIVDAKAGKLGRLEPMGGAKTHYDVGKKMPGVKISVLSATVDDAGKPLVISEMPLPHVKGRDMNAPKYVGDKGAQWMNKAKVGAAVNSNRR